MDLTRRQLLLIARSAAGIALVSGTAGCFTTKAVKDASERRSDSLKGKHATNFSLRDGNKSSASYGKTVSLSSYEGKLTLVNFWDILCGCCLPELSDMGRLYDAYSHNVRILAVNMHFHPDVNELEEQYDRFRAEYLSRGLIKYPLLGFPNDSELKSQKAYSALQEMIKPIWEAYAVASVPRTLLISSQGVIQEDIAEATTFDTLEKLVKKYL